MSLPKTETSPIPVMTIRFLGSVSRFGADIVGESMALIALDFGAEHDTLRQKRITL